MPKSEFQNSKCKSCNNVHKKYYCMKNNSNFLRSFWILLIVLISASSASISAQNSREYIRNAIKGWGSCRNVSITKRNGDIALYGRNGWAASGCSS